MRYVSDKLFSPANIDISKVKSKSVDEIENSTGDENTAKSEYWIINSES